MEDNVFQNRVDLTILNEQVKKIKDEIGKVIVGQEIMIDLLVTAILADGHVLIEGVPGVAKTLTAKLLSLIHIYPIVLPVADRFLPVQSGFE